MKPAATDFFQRQEDAKNRTRILVLLFAFAVIGIIVVVYFALKLFMEGPMWDPELLLGVSLFVGIVVAGGSLFKISQLAGGGQAVAELLGGKLVDPATTDLRLRQLLNIVEEMAIASGIPVPDVYVLADEQAINAFAAGFSPADATIGITLGALDRLDRDEIQGVIAHEFSHILNGDMRLNIRLMGILYGILCLAIIGRVLMRSGFWVGGARSSSRDGKSNGGAAIMVGGLVLFLAGYIGVFFAKLIQAAVSRQREFLADASAVQFTRNPGGIAGALYKIGGFSGRLQTPRAEEASHLYFGNGLGDSWFTLFSTHPPIEERIRAIAPDFDPSSVKSSPRPARSDDGKNAPVPRSWLGHAGAPRPAHVEHAAALLSALPQEAKITLREINGARTTIYALLLDESEPIRTRQIDALALDPQSLAATLHTLAEIEPLSSEERITMIDLAIPTLRHMPPAEYQEFHRKVQALIAADDQVHLFEYLLQKMLFRHLDRFFVKAAPPSIRFKNLLPLLPDVAVLLSALVHLGGADKEASSKAYADGIRELLVNPQTPALQQIHTPGIADIDRALTRLAEASPSIRRQILLACGQAVMSDGQIADGEAQLLRAIADTLDCPVPPFVSKQ